MAGAKCHHGVPTHWKAPSSVHDLTCVVNDLSSSSMHNNFLFIVQLVSGFTGLLRLGELTFPDKLADCDFWKITICPSFEWLPNAFAFWLPSHKHKADTTFEGNHVIFKKIVGGPDPVPIYEEIPCIPQQSFPFACRTLAAC
jgi:hypothetical protein